MQTYQVKLEKFQGPLDLLLQLIEKNKLDITEVSLAQVTDQYLKYLENSKEIILENLADFLLVAAQLILIKSKVLLPDLELDEEDELSAEELQNRLYEFKRFKNASRKLKELYFSENISFEQKFYPEDKIAFYPGSNLTQENLKKAYETVLVIFEKFKPLKEEVIRETISVKEKIIHLQHLISKQVNIRFKSILTKAKSRLEVIVSFLALLELVKQRIVKVNQEKTFGEIELRRPL